MNRNKTIAMMLTGIILVSLNMFVLTSGFIVAMLLDERRISKRVGAAMVGGYLAYMAMLYL